MNKVRTALKSLTTPASLSAGIPCCSGRNPTGKSVSHEKQRKKKKQTIFWGVEGRLKATDGSTLKHHPFMMITLVSDVLHLNKNTKLLNAKHNRHKSEDLPAELGGILQHSMEEFALGDYQTHQNKESQELSCTDNVLMDSRFRTGSDETGGCGKSTMMKTFLSSFYLISALWVSVRSKSKCAKP